MWQAVGPDHEQRIRCAGRPRDELRASKRRQQQQGGEEHDPERQALHAWTLAAEAPFLLQLDITPVLVHGYLSRTLAYT